jgi:hypothetical protein
MNESYLDAKAIMCYAFFGVDAKQAFQPELNKECPVRFSSG